MKHPKAIAEIHGRRWQRHLIDTGEMEFAILRFSEVPLGHPECPITRVYAMKPPHERRNEACPPPTSTPHIEARRLLVKLLLGEDVEVLRKQGRQFGLR
jgi:hypothetical protein